MCSYKPLAIVLALGVAVAEAQPGTAAPGDSMPWMLVLSAQTDEDSYRGLLGGFHLGVSEATWLSLIVGSSRAPDTEPEIRASLAQLAVEHDFGPLGLSFTAESWGDSKNLESRDWQAGIFFSRERYRLDLSYERRDIDIFFSSPLGSDLRRAAIEASGFWLSGRVRLSPDWQIYGSWMEHDYPSRLRIVPRADRLDLLSASTVTLAYSLDDRYASVGVERAFGQTLLNVDLGRDRSAIGGTTLKSLSATVLWPAAQRIDLEFTLGTSRVGGFGSSLYGGFGFLLYGD